MKCIKNRASEIECKQQKHMVEDSLNQQNDSANDSVNQQKDSVYDSVKDCAKIRFNWFEDRRIWTRLSKLAYLTQGVIFWNWFDLICLADLT